MISFEQIDDNLLVGGCPNSQPDAEQLKNKLGVSAILNLQTDSDFEQWDVDWVQLEQSYTTLGIELRRVPITDGDPDDLRDRLPAAVEVLRELLSAGHRVYLHCTAGAERSPTVAGAYLAWSRGWSVDDVAAPAKRMPFWAPNLDLIHRFRSGGES